MTVIIFVRGMSKANLLALPGRQIAIADTQWKVDVLPLDDIEVPQEELPDPDCDNLPSTSRPIETPKDLDKRWSDLGLLQQSSKYILPNLVGFMGNEQSGSGEASSLSFLQKAKGISPRVVHTNKVIVVHAGNEPNGYEPSKDEDLIKLKDIPQFYPILRGTLNLPGIKDPTDLYTKFSSRPLLALCQRFQEHLMITSEIVAAEQGALGTRIREIDYAIATLANYLSERKKSYDKFANDLQKVRDVSVQLKKISANLQELVPSAHILNLLLPESERLPLLDLSNIVVESSDKFVCEGTEEQKVVDWSQDEVTDNR